MNSFTFLAVDLDGTLVRNDHNVSDFTADTLIQAQEQGLKVAICTGRPTDGTRHIAKRIRMQDFGGYVIGYNGGEVIECQSGKVIRDLLLPSSVMRQALDFAEKAGADLVTFCDGHIISTSDTNPVVIRSSVRNKMDIVKADNWMEAVEGLKLHKCMLVGEPDRLIPMEKEVKAAFAGVIEAFCSEPQFLELSPLGVNKGEGLRWLLEYAAVDTTAVMSFGDTPSDIPMIRLAGRGVAMGNAPQTVKDVADAVALSNEEDGVARMLKKYVLT